MRHAMQEMKEQPERDDRSAGREHRRTHFGNEVGSHRERKQISGSPLVVAQCRPRGCLIPSGVSITRAARADPDYSQNLSGVAARSVRVDGDSPFSHSSRRSFRQTLVSRTAGPGEARADRVIRKPASFGPFDERRALAPGGSSLLEPGTPSLVPGMAARNIASSVLGAVQGS